MLKKILGSPIFVFALAAGSLWYGIQFGVYKFVIIGVLLIALILWLFLSSLE